MWKSTFRLFFTVELLILTACSLTPSEVPEITGCTSDFLWSERNGVVTIKGYIGSNKNIIIPSELNGHPVRCLGSSAFYTNALTNVIIPDSVFIIADFCFVDSALQHISIGQNVTYIGWSAFNGCLGLSNIIIPSAVTSIGVSAFSYCFGLTNITVDSNNIHYQSLDGVLFSKDGTLLIQFPIGKSGNYTIPDSVTSIGYSSFSDCHGLTNINMTNSITTIGYAAFYYCYGLTTINIPASVSSIDDYAFYGCYYTTNIYVNASTPPVIGVSVFDNPASGRKFYVPSGSVSAYQTSWSAYSADIFSQ